MSLDVSIWSDVQVNVQTVRAAPLTISAITKANPAVATYTGTDPANGDILLILAAGMNQVDYMLVRVADVDGGANTFELEGVDSTDFATFISGTAEKLTFGAAAATITDMTPSGGEAEDIAIRTIHNSQDKSLPGNFAPLVYGLGNLWDANDPALLAMRAFGKTKTPCGIEIIFANGVKVYFAATPSASLAPGGSAGGLVTTPAKLNLRGDLTTYAA
jgi:hypothetical protein